MNVTLVRLNPTPTVDPTLGTLKVTQSIIGATPFAVDQSSSTLYAVTEIIGPISLELDIDATLTATSNVLATPSTLTCKSLTSFLREPSLLQLVTHVVQGPTGREHLGTPGTTHFSGREAQSSKGNTARTSQAEP